MNRSSEERLQPHSANSSAPKDIWFTRLSNLLPSRTLSFTALLVAGVTLCGGIELGRRPSNANAVEAGQTQAAVQIWTNASFPVEDFQAYTSPFGYRQDPYNGGQRFHYGLDMAAPSGSYIRNWWAGKVVEVSDDSACGTSVVVESGEWLHIYCHMHGYVVNDGRNRYMVDREGGVQIREGQDIASGARIGRVGMTGRTTGPHLHWGLKYRENWVDPALVLRAMYDSQRSAMNRPQ
ncbi:M23 family metallopeptidase [Pseudanabaena sp. FACHB-2040]|uniref:M23 family metallopeptidase n=1 Tax=Pseudanabaena sp. FACHB-2040 TaxID=2692859 RepID=UPI00168553E5|nr:M23 family metallopeptidase [Pseudanabaena sp. FACHB-2040]MBD2259573.1 M23 family metallopeptidase [Pseudanabaena sp. FACHB-2040]